ncbi:MAG: hypothetical protein ABJ275_00065 [Maricaulaceae bacterium]
MLKFYADTFKLSEAELSEEKLRRLKLYTLLGLPAFPLIALVYFKDFSLSLTFIIGLIGLISLGFVMVTMTSRFINRFWARDKYLDEWEVARKHHAMAIGHQVTDYMFMALGAIFFIASIFIKKTITINLEILAGTAFGVVVFMIYVPHIFLLWTVKPSGTFDNIDSSEKIASKVRLKNILMFTAILIGAGLMSGFLFGYFDG